MDDVSKGAVAGAVGDATTSFFANDVRTAMFPTWEVRVKMDEYGEAITAEDYIRDAFDSLNRQEVGDK